MLVFKTFIEGTILHRQLLTWTIQLLILVTFSPSEQAVSRVVASLTVPDGQEFHFLHFFLKFWSIFPQTLLIFFLILTLRVGTTGEGPGYTTASEYIYWHLFPCLILAPYKLQQIPQNSWRQHKTPCPDTNISWFYIFFLLKTLFYLTK